MLSTPHTIDETDDQTVQTDSLKRISMQNWLIFISFLFAVKYSFYLIDSFPLFFLGDSGSYIHTSLTGWIPPDRSFMYGYVIRILTVYVHSLQPLVIVQILLSIFTAYIMLFSFSYFFKLTPGVVYLLGFLFVIDPYQLLYERSVMTENMSLFILSLYLLVSLFYIKNKNILCLVCYQSIGVVLISFRLSFLPLIWANTILLPILSLSFVRTNEQDCVLKKTMFSTLMTNFSKWEIPRITVHLLFSVLILILLHTGYKHINGFLSNKSPNYQYRAGLFLLSDWAPNVKPVDFPISNDRKKIFNNLSRNLNDRRLRSFHRWVEGGLIKTMRHYYPDIVEAERLAWQTAINCLKRDPLGILKLGILTFKDFWDINYLKKCIIVDIGYRQNPSNPKIKNFMGVVEKNFQLNVENYFLRNQVIQKYFLFSWPYILYTLIQPLLLLVLFPTVQKNQRKYFFLIFIAVCQIFCVVVFLSERPVARFLYPAAWGNFLVFGLLINHLYSQKWFCKKVQSNLS